MEAGERGVHPGCFWQRVSNRLERKEIHFALLQESERVRQERRRATERIADEGAPLPCFFVSIHSKGVRNRLSVSIHFKGVRRFG